MKFGRKFILLLVVGVALIPSLGRTEEGDGIRLAVSILGLDQVPNPPPSVSYVTHGPVTCWPDPRTAHVSFHPVWNVGHLDQWNWFCDCSIVANSCVYTESSTGQSPCPYPFTSVLFTVSRNYTSCFFQGGTTPLLPSSNQPSLQYDLPRTTIPAFQADLPGAENICSTSCGAQATAHEANTSWLCDLPGPTTFAQGENEEVQCSGPWWASEFVPGGTIRVSAATAVDADASAGS